MFPRQFVVFSKFPDGEFRFTPEIPRKSPLDAPVVALFAKLLLEVAQGETMAAHGPPVGDLLGTEEVCHHGLAAAGTLASEALLVLLPAERSQRGREGRVNALATIRRRSGNGRSELLFLQNGTGKCASDPSVCCMCLQQGQSIINSPSATAKAL